MSVVGSRAWASERLEDAGREALRVKLAGIGKIEPVVAELAVRGARALASWLYDKLRGHDGEATDERVLAEIQRKGIEAMLAASIAEAQHVLTMVELRHAFAELEVAVQRVAGEMITVGIETPSPTGLISSEPIQPSTMPTPPKPSKPGAPKPS